MPPILDAIFFYYNENHVKNNCFHRLFNFFFFVLPQLVLSAKIKKEFIRKRGLFYGKDYQFHNRSHQTQPGVYVSRKDPVGNSVITTFDIRMTSPNEEPVMNTAELHTIEHLAATFLRNHKEFGPKMIYWGPMGCRTGNYLLLNGDYESKDIVPLMVETFEFIRDFEGEVPGASPKDCGNYLDMNLGMAKYLAKKFLDEVLYDIKPDRLVYPK